MSNATANKPAARQISNSASAFTAQIPGAASYYKWRYRVAKKAEQRELAFQGLVDYLLHFERMGWGRLALSACMEIYQASDYDDPRQKDYEFLARQLARLAAFAQTKSLANAAMDYLPRLDNNPLPELAVHATNEAARLNALQHIERLNQGLLYEKVLEFNPNQEVQDQIFEKVSAGSRQSCSICHGSGTVHQPGGFLSGGARYGGLRQCQFCNGTGRNREFDAALRWFTG